MASFNYQEYMNKNPELYDEFVGLIAQLLIHYDLDEIYHENRVEAHKLLDQKMSYEKLPFAKRAIVVINFKMDLKKILEKIESVNEDNHEEMLMLLVYIVRFFERIVNEHIHFELENRDFTQSEIGAILRKFTIDEKMGWFLKILSGKDYTQTNSKSWSLLKSYIITRNFYIHYSPATFEVSDNHEMKLSKESFKSFIEASSNCYSFLSECRSKDIKDQYERVNNLKNCIKDLDIKDRKDQYEELNNLKKRVDDLKNNVKGLDIKDKKDQYEKIDALEKNIENLLNNFKELGSNQSNLEGSEG